MQYTHNCDDECATAKSSSQNNNDAAWRQINGFYMYTGPPRGEGSRGPESGLPRGPRWLSAGLHVHVMHLHVANLQVAQKQRKTS